MIHDMAVTVLFTLVLRLSHVCWEAQLILVRSKSHRSKVVLQYRYFNTYKLDIAGQSPSGDISLQNEVLGQLVCSTSFVTVRYVHVAQESLPLVLHNISTSPNQTKTRQVRPKVLLNLDKVLTQNKSIST